MADQVNQVPPAVEAVAQQPAVETTQVEAAPEASVPETKAEAVEAKAEEKAEEKTEVKAEEKAEEKTEKTEEKTGESAATTGDDSKRQRNRNNYSNSQRNKHKSQIKAKFDDLPVTDDPVQIRKQAEFYFSDSNLPMDAFLFKQVGGKENNAVPVKLIASFKRMRRFQPFEAVINALKESTLLEIVEEDKVRRRVPIEVAEQNSENVRVFEDAAMPRTVYAKGFGEETEKTQLEIEGFFEKYGPINAVRLRRTYHEKIFKGSAFIEFATEEKANEFLNQDPKPQWNGEDLLIMSKKSYCDMKVQEIKDGKIRAQNGRPKRGNFRGRGGRGRGGRGGRGGYDNSHKRQRDDEAGSEAKRPHVEKENGVKPEPTTA